MALNFISRKGDRAMRRCLFSIGLILILGGPAARASISLSTNGFPATYTPGSTITFDVMLSGAAGLNNYSVNLDLTSNTGTAGADFSFAGGTQPASDYVFDPSLGVTAGNFWGRAPHTRL